MFTKHDKQTQPSWFTFDYSQKEQESNAHQTLRAYPGNKNKATIAQEEGTIHGIEHPGSTGVIYVMDRAMKNGFTYDSEGWANFGQGAPEGMYVYKRLCLAAYWP